VRYLWDVKVEVHGYTKSLTTSFEANQEIQRHAKLKFNKTLPTVQSHNIIKEAYFNDFSKLSYLGTYYFCSVTFPPMAALIAASEKKPL